MNEATHEQHSTLATFVLPIAKSLRLQGVDPMELLAEADIDPAHVINADRRIPAAKMQQLFSLALRETGNPAFGLLAAEQVQAATLQGLGLAFLASDTVLDALQRLVRFCHVLSTGVELRLQQRDELIDLEFHVGRVVEDDEADYASLDFGMGLVMVMCRMTLGDYVSPISVDTRRPEPEDPDLFMSLMGAKIHFGAEIDRVSFVRSDIVDQLLTANQELAKINDDQAEAYLASFDDVSTARDVVSKIVEKLPDGPPNQSQIAGALNVSNRTLQRKLKDEGTSFVDLLQDTRLELARKYLHNPARSISEISYLLGFSEPSTFSRAFKRWTGEAPADYRQRLQQTSKEES
ncbi:AraC family transcriptional regulator [Halieaceae bacterium IMCC14734]|uniref:AraC family transcriptional regulator n=1 Tax=Candidatus Litorirhabdus singularis TaxID=2518993 RepID=A0ABT3TGZ6_9GAMM|nr:AraC family transcriptional regulator [Candidatus Litorirhabdus singularis]MCX2981577.1 AraC family transcriptional regulator [Candidatus Litorirhabdus singularis]